MHYAEPDTNSWQGKEFEKSKSNENHQEKIQKKEECDWYDGSEKSFGFDGNKE